jgi:Fe2+ or Zn2+ uptake regulation protein
MVTYRTICAVGDMLRNNHHKYLTLSQISTILMKHTNCHGSKTIRNYLKILEHEGYIKAVTVDNVPLLEVMYANNR